MRNTATFSLLVIRANDLSVSLEFYRAIGLEWREERHGEGPLHYSCVCGDVLLELYPHQGESKEEATMLGFNVTSLEVVLGALQNLNIVPQSPPKTSPWGTWAKVRDPDGRAVRLNQI